MGSMESTPESGEASEAHKPAGLAEFASLCEQLAATSRKLEKRALIAAYLRSLNIHDAGLAAMYLAGAPFPQTAGRQLNVGGALLSRVVAEVSGASQAAMHAGYLRHGDLGGATYDLLQELPHKRSPEPTLTLEDLAAAFAAITEAPKPAARQGLVLALLQAATALEAKYLIKIILGDMRTGVKESLVEEAIALAYEAEIAQVRRAMMLNGNLMETVAMAATRHLAEARMKLFHPLGFMLASPVETVEEAIERFSQEIQAEPAAKGEVSEELAAGAGDLASVIVTKAQLEDKYDGIRAQIHCGDPEQPGRVALFSRSRDDMTTSFPEIVEAFARFPEPVILDGELLAWSPAAGEDASQLGRALPFASLQTRLGRKRVTAEMRAETPIVFMAFDLLYAGGELLLERPLEQRRQALAALVARDQERTNVGSHLPAPAGAQDSLAFDAPPEDGFPRLVLAPAVHLESVAQLEQAYVDARARGNEGVMLKSRHSLYQPGRRGLAWLKLKRELATLDVVVTAAEYGHGRRAGSLSDYTFAVRDGDKLRNVGKAYSGVTDAEIAKLTQFFLDHTVEDFGYVRSVEPVLVLEVAFNNVTRSSRHDSGFALRFPRILRVREDKPVSEIDTLERVAEIYESQPDRPVEE